jgi:hypothetical protein
MSEEPIAEAVPPAATITPAPKRSALRWITPVLGGLALLVIGLFGGILIGQHTAGARDGFASGAFGQDFRPGQGGFSGAPGPNSGQGGAANRAGFTTGTISSIDGDSLVVELADGTKVTITTSDATTVATTQEGTLGDLSVGDRISVVGQKKGDDVVARSITEGGLLGNR